MKRIILIFLSIFSASLPALSQTYHPFPDSNATWCDERYDNGWPVPNYYYSFYRTDGKTWINDTLYTVISDHDNFTRCYIREEDRKVYCRPHEEAPEFVLYDFGLVVGDTFMLSEWCGEVFYEGWANQVDSILIGSDYHKTIHIESWDWHSVTFIEGIGSDLGFMYCDLPWVDVWGDLYCFSLKDTIYEINGSGHMTPGNCWIYVGTPEIHPDSITVFPNPAGDVIRVDYGKDGRLVLTNLAGSIVRESEGNQMKISDLSRGMYILKVYSPGGLLRHRAKILKR